jgi:D-beta-D-heptose 7-phosphate kinase/D-beta-D-heptose 1-phosphate adenosyltransferase
MEKKVYRSIEKFDFSLTGVVVFTNGCFDILHPGHLAYLKQARSLGDILIVGLNSDHSIRMLKGESRPINNFKYRSAMLEFLDFVDYIIEFDELTPTALIVQLNPAILVKGGDYRFKFVAGSDLVLANGGKIEFIDFLEGYSTSSQIERILQAYGCGSSLL